MKRSDISTIEVLRACRAFHQGRLFLAPWEILRKLTGAPEKVIYAAMLREIERDNLEYGVSFRTAWLTDKGRELLKKLEAENQKERTSEGS